ncbi:MAG: dienelactone hydrolase family protein [Allosphingosinicella sp.]|uniref:dienelactone hydrolase family protein n=1 Tax=Allosphingosinicella sp. TaxID=2823234 RepID=UPI00395EB530
MTDPVTRAVIALYDRFTHEGMDRRAFMAELVRVTGSAVAASAMLGTVAAQAGCAPVVPTDDTRLRTETITWEVRQGRQLSLYSAMPERGGGDRPAVVVVHENRGLNDHIRDVARRVALAGYAAYAPDFLTPAGGTPADEDRARDMIGALDMPATVADGAALIRRLAGINDGRKVGAVGFCWGGAMVHRLALAAGPALAGGVSFYGPAPEPSEAARLQTPLLVVLAGRDERVNRTALPYVEAARAAGKDVRAVTYPDVDHAFHNDTSQARYNQSAAQQAWAETLGFFRRHLA